ncbi:cell cycle checkpoint protein RAD1 homolog mrt-2 [Tetranychus urticae]|uniref:Uncharacterized protein n=1 Tax=Tetranychus urticae TaxID=32264 RepID=T1KM77_TETUR|nr:cell cycle checkpoint protein RAD1 homolog mrt-2 [Tetranychus urticae]
MANRGDDVSFEAIIEDCRVLLKALQSICFGDRATVVVNQQGIILKVEQAKCCQLSIFLEWALFKESPTIKDSFSFSINSKELIMFLSIFAGDNDEPLEEGSEKGTTLKLKYKGMGDPFYLSIGKEDKCITECKLYTFDPQDSLNIELDDADITNKAILDVPYYKEIWADFDSASKELGIEFSTNPECLRFITKSSYERTAIELYPSCKGVTTLECNENQINFYQMSFIKLSQKILNQASKFNLSTNNDGLLSMTFCIQLETERAAFARFFCVANRPDDL